MSSDKDEETGEGRRRRSIEESDHHRQPSSHVPMVIPTDPDDDDETNRGSFTGNTHDLEAENIAAFIYDPKATGGKKPPSPSRPKPTVTISRNGQVKHVYKLQTPMGPPKEGFVRHFGTNGKTYYFPKGKSTFAARIYKAAAIQDAMEAAAKKKNHPTSSKL
mmetsp:Transcript_20622/g.59742  ORF Transcript_20622/g.59742 Transcript_20622/m.59742 type:complete len:162 (+) Transcript_20622:134-619(+)